jgi:hypothetical protein
MGMNPLKNNKHWTGIRRQPNGEEDRRKAARKKKFE